MSLLLFLNKIGENDTTTSTLPILNGLDAWIDASDTTTITGTGSDVTLINSKVTGGRDLTQGTIANSPTTGNTVNGRNALLFNGSTDFMVMTNSVAWGNQNYTMFFVGIPQAIKDQKFFVGHDGGSGVVGFDAVGGGDNIRGLNGTNAIISSVGATYLNNPSIIASRRNDIFLEVFYNRGLNASNNIITNRNTPNNWILGREDASGGRQYFEGLFCELLVYGRALDAAEMASVEAYLAAKWGITLL